MAYSYYGAQVNRHLCFSMVLSSALLIQHPVGIEPEIESSWESSVIRSKSDRNDVYRARSGWEWEAERRCWLLLYPRTGISTGHAQLIAWVLHKTLGYGIFHTKPLLSMPRWWLGLGAAILSLFHQFLGTWFLPSESSRTLLLQHGMLFLHNCSQSEPIQQALNGFIVSSTALQ